MAGYFLNWMGPIRPSFYQEYGDLWAGGRIDVYRDFGPDENPYPEEFAVPVMFKWDWAALQHWLETAGEFKTGKELFHAFEEYNGRAIVWWEKDFQLAVISAAHFQQLVRGLEPEQIDSYYNQPKLFNFRLTSICSNCKEYFQVEFDAPFAHCACATSEWLA